MTMAPALSVSRTFPLEPGSVPAARRFVREAVLAAGQDDWLDDALLGVSEVTTNALLHAHTPFEVTVTAGQDGVYVQVWDDDASPPARRASEPTSTTGRGLQLLAAVATAQGVQIVGPTKVVWFSLGMPRPEDSEDVLLDRWRDSEDAVTGAARDDVGVAVLQGMPVSLWLSAREHHNTLMREFSLHEQAHGGGAVPSRLVAADRARSRVLMALRAAVPVGSDVTAVDLRLELRPEDGQWFHCLREVLDDAERLARDGRLLAAPGPAAIVAVRHWACRQVLDQLAGAAPTAWDGPLRLP